MQDIIDISDDDKEEPKTEKLNHTNWRDEVVALLSSECYAGATHYTTKGDNTLNPGLYLNDYGWIGLPLSGRSIEAVLRAESKSQSRWLNLEDNGCISFSSAEFQFHNTAWSNFAETMKSRAVQRLDIVGECVLGPATLLISKQGTWKPPASDSRPEGAFATLMLSLPSDHGFCQLELCHEGAVDSIDVASSEVFNCITSLWLDGVHPSVCHDGEIFIFLVYDVVMKGTAQAPTIKSADDHVSNLRAKLRSWTSDLAASLAVDCIMIKTTQYYDCDEVCPFVLEPADRKQYNVLKQACIGSDCSFYLLSVERVQEGENGADCDEDNTRFRIVDQQGYSILHRKDCGPAKLDFLGSDWFDNPCEEFDIDSEEDWLAEDCHVTTTYSSSAFLLVPTTGLTAFLIDTAWPEDMSERIEFIENAYHEYDSDRTDDSHRQLISLCIKMLDKLHKLEMAGKLPSEYQQSSKEDVKAIMDACLRTGTVEGRGIFLRAFKSWRPNINIFTDEDLKYVATLLARLGVKPLTTTLSAVFARSNNILQLLDQLKLLRQQSIEGLVDIGGKHDLNETESTRNAAKGTNQDEIDGLTAWIDKRMAQAITNMDWNEHDTIYNLNQVMDRCCDSTRPFLVAPCLALLERSFVTCHHVHMFFQHFVSKVGDNSEFATLASRSFDILLGKLKHEPVNGSYLPHLGSFISEFLDFEPSYTTKLVRALLPHPQLHVASGLPSRWIGMIPKILAKPVKHNEQQRHLNALITTVLAAYLVQNVGFMPQPMPLRRSGLSCQPNCEVCLTLNFFLWGDNQQTFTSEGWSIAMRKHAFHQLQSQIPDCSLTLECSTKWTSSSAANQICLQKIDAQYGSTIHKWNSKKQPFEETMAALSKTHTEEQLKSILGSLFGALTRRDINTASNFLHEAYTKSLLNYAFTLPERPVTDTKENMQLLITGRGGTIEPLLLIDDRSIRKRKLIKVTSVSLEGSTTTSGIMQFPGSSASPPGFSECDIISENDLHAFLNDCLSTKLITSLQTPVSDPETSSSISIPPEHTHSTDDTEPISNSNSGIANQSTPDNEHENDQLPEPVNPVGTKRSADDMSGGPLTESQSAGRNTPIPSSIISDKRAKIEDETYSHDKENIDHVQWEEEGEVHDSTDY